MWELEECENLCGKVADGIKGFLAGHEFNFCSEQCRQAFAKMLATMGHTLTIPEQAKAA